MARRRTNRSTASGGWGRWWWLALPALGIAAWAAFDATLGLVSSDRPDETAPLLDAPRAAIAPQATAPVAVEEPAAPTATLAPLVAAEPSATPAARAAADGGQKPAKRKPPAPKENITEQDRRALERVLERATEQGPR